MLFMHLFSVLLSVLAGSELEEYLLMVLGSKKKEK